MVAEEYDNRAIRYLRDYFSKIYGLRYEINGFLRHVSATDSENIYCSTYNKALEIGYKPEFSSMDAIKEESKYIINQ